MWPTLFLSRSAFADAPLFLFFVKNKAISLQPRKFICNGTKEHNYKIEKLEMIMRNHIL
jgi:hypothetical protein